jgi:hypothetical protein
MSTGPLSFYLISTDHRQISIPWGKIANILILNIRVPVLDLNCSWLVFHYFTDHRQG